jgi:hypothetical protein
VQVSCRGEAKVSRGDEAKITGDRRAANPRGDTSLVSRGVFSSVRSPRTLVHGRIVDEAPVLRYAESSP